jgi:chemotaxis protein methyltransferase CheR
MQQNLKQDDDKEFAFSDRDFRFLASLVSGRTGIILSDNKKNMVYSRLTRRLRALKLSSFAEYCELVEKDTGDEMSNLVNAITTNLTSFFREEHHFEHLREHILLPIYNKSPANRRIRIWSAGCSAGMEAYSIAMTIRSVFKNMNGWDIRILATDIDTNMLNTGKNGKYSIEQLAKIPKHYHPHVKISEGNDQFTVSEELRNMVAFKPLNLLEEWPMSGKFDAVFCRNVVIYFDKPTQARLFNRMADFIKDDGWLYIGHSENLNNVCDRFQPIGHTIYRKLR